MEKKDGCQPWLEVLPQLAPARHQQDLLREVILVDVLEGTSTVDEPEGLLHVVFVESHSILQGVRIGA